MSRLRRALHHAWRSLRVFARRAARPARRRLLARLARSAWYAAAAGLALLAAVLTAARLYLPAVAERHAELEAYLSRELGHQVRFERLSTYWDGFHPGLRLEGIAIYAGARSQPSVRLEELRVSLAVLPLLWGELQIDSLVLRRPRLSLERLDDGRLYVTGFEPLPLTVDGGETNGALILRWLFRQGRLAVEDGELQWFDHREPNAALHLTNVNFTLRNRGERHRLGFTASFPPQLCESCLLAADVEGNPLAGNGAWQGKLYLRARGMDVAQLPRAVRERLPAGFGGRFDLELWSRWEDGRPQHVYGEAKVGALRLPLPAAAGERVLAVRAARADLEWRRSGSGWRLDLRRLALGLTGPAWEAGGLRLVYHPQALALRAHYLDLGDLARFLASAAPAAVAADTEPWLKKGLDHLVSLAPEGGVQDLKLDVHGSLADPEDWRLEAVFENLRTRVLRPLPGVEGFNGRLALTRAGGELALRTRAARLSIPWVFRETLPLGELRGTFAWRREDGLWRVSSPDFSLRSPDIEAKGQWVLRWPDDPRQSPYLRLLAEFRHGNVAHARRYFPAGVLRPSVLAWMERSFLGGVVSEGRLVFDGPLRDFPFRGGEGRFEVHARVHDGVYGYLPGWEPVRDAEAVVLVRGEEVLVTGHGRIGALAVSDVVVRYHRDEQGRRLVRVLGNAEGELGEALRILQVAKPPPGHDDWKQLLPAGLRASGSGRLGLEVAVEIRPPGVEDIVTFTGDYRVREAVLALEGTPLRIEGIQGAVRFDESAVREGAFAGRFFGGEAALAIVPQGPRAVLVRAQGRVEAATLARAYLAPPLAARVEGEAPWQAQWHWPLTGGGAGRLEAEIALGEIKTRLPPPLDHPQGLPVEKLVLRTVASARKRHVLEMFAGEALAGRIAFERAPDWRFAHATLVLGGEGRLPPSSAAAGGRGLEVHLDVDRLDADAWLPLLGGEQRRPVPEVLTHLVAEVRSLRLFEREFGALRLAVARTQRAWRGSLEGTGVSGNLRWAPQDPDGARLELDLAKLHIPPAPSAPAAVADHRARGAPYEPDPRRLPAVSVFVRSFQVKARELGELDFLATPEPGGWHIQRLGLAHPHMRLEASGHWRRTAAGPKSEFELHFTSPDLGKALESLGIPEQVSGAQTEVRAALAWPGAPYDIRYPKLGGWIELESEKGRFLKLEPGAGRFLGMLDLSAIARYLTFDFSPLFGKGFVFDKLSGRLDIDNGDAYTRDFVVKGPSATLGAVGRVGFATEDFDLVLEVRPHMSDTLTIASWGLFGPQVAAAVFALQKLFKKQITESARVVYVVKGPWDDPKIERLDKRNGKKKGAEAPAADEGAAGQ